MGVTAAFGTARHVVQVVDPLDVEGDVLATFDEGQVAASLVDARERDRVAAIDAHEVATLITHVPPSPLASPPRPGAEGTPVPTSPPRSTDRAPQPQQPAAWRGFA